MTTPVSNDEAANSSSSQHNEPTFVPRGLVDSSAPTEFNLDETLDRISSKKGVHGVVIVNRQGMAIRSTLPVDLTRQYAHLLNGLVQQARTVVHDLDSESQNELTFLRLRTKKHEIMVAPDNEYLLIVIQNPQEHYQ